MGMELIGFGFSQLPACKQPISFFFRKHTCDKKVTVSAERWLKNINE
jgi:hypothetical protein